MENRVYYGEYSLKHWIELILKQDIVLPPYQRIFVWSEEKVKKLIESFKNDEFIPPVTIGLCNVKNEKGENIIIDGQQRLTSILLAYLNVFPKKEYHPNKVDITVSENDDVMDSENDAEDTMNWRFSSLVEKGDTRDKIREQIGNAYIDNFGTKLGVNDDFLKNHYLGFSYLVPEKVDLNDQQKYYSSVFRNINRQGEPLREQESREALYYLDDNLTKLFNPDYCRSITINNLNIDFLRSLAIVSQYKKLKNEIRSVAKGFRNKMEEYYEIYIYANIRKEDNDLFELLTDDYRRNISDSLDKSIRALDLNRDYPSIIDFDLFFFGLLYFVVFENKNIKLQSKDELTKKIAESIDTLKMDHSHTKSPSCLKYLRTRLQTSINIYNNYLE